MTKFFRILQLKGLGLPQGEIASSCAVSKSTVSKVLKKASELGLASQSRHYGGTNYSALLTVTRRIKHYSY